MYYAGLDLHRKYCTLCVLTSEGHLVCDHRRRPAELEPLTTILRDLGGPVTVTVEATLQCGRGTEEQARTTLRQMGATDV